MIITERLSVAPFTEAHGQVFFDLTCDRGFRSHPITDYRQASVASACVWIVHNPHKLGVWEKSSGELIGMGGLSPWQWECENLIDVTYRLRESAWGKGYGSELARALIEYGQKNLQAPLTATITPDTLGPKKIAEKLGMTYEKRIILLGVQTDLYRLQR